MSADIRGRKNFLREHYTKKRQQLDAEQKKLLDTEISRRVLATLAYKNCKGVMLYSALPQEIDLTPVLKDALASGRKLALPRCVDGCNMVFLVIDDLSQLAIGRFGIMEPSPHCEKARTEDFQLCVVPAISFDKNGYRLGYGKGYYDRAISGYTGTKAGVVYSEFLETDLPHGRFDIRMDVIITEKGVTPVSVQK